ncbi:unnamed protein product [Scytosiphon promiscuus]
MDRAGSPRRDREALQALYWSAGGPRWTRNQGWVDNDDDLNSWHGVTVDKHGRVLRLDLNRNNLDGTIPAALGYLGHLVYLRMSFNSLTGPIPGTIGNLSRLNYLDVGSNQLTGSIPPELGKLTDVSKLDFSCNLLGGHIPPEIGNMTGLLLCWLEKNHIQGPIPAEMCDIPQLTDLDLAENRVEEGRLQGRELKLWKEQARQRLIAQQSSHRRGSGSYGADGAEGFADTKKYLDHILAKDQEIAELKQEIEQLRKPRNGSVGLSSTGDANIRGSPTDAELPEPCRL